jgi:hypothetical protein
MRRPLLVVTVTIIFVLALAALAMAADPHVGTWKMNAAKSKFNPGPPPKSDTLTFTAQDNGIKAKEDYVDANGKAYHMGCAAKYDGKDYPFTGSPDIDTIAFRRIGAYTFNVVLKKAGKEVSRIQEVFSKDGKILTLTEKGKDAKGQDVNNTWVYDKISV